MHIGNHFYFEKQEKETQQWYFKTVLPARELASQFPTKHPDDCQIFFAILMHILLKKIKRKESVVLALSLTSWTSDCYLQHKALYILMSRWTCGEKNKIK